MEDCTCEGVNGNCVGAAEDVPCDDCPCDDNAPLEMILSTSSFLTSGLGLSVLDRVFSLILYLLANGFTEVS